MPEEERDTVEESDVLEAEDVLLTAKRNLEERSRELREMVR